MKASPATVGIVADLHCGSRWGMLAPTNEEHKQNVGHEYLWSCWKWMIDHWPKLDLLVLNGDLIDGKQRKSGGTCLLTTDLSQQAEMAQECLQPLIDKLKPKKIIRTAGTAYHEEFDGALKYLDAKFGIPRERVASEPDPFDIALADGKVLNIKHHPEGEAALYVGTVQDRETIWATITEDRQGLPRAKFLIRSHLHMHGRFDGCGKVHCLTPCWQLASGYAKKRRYYRWHPTIGGLLMLHEPMHDDKYLLAKTTFKLPQRKAIPYEQL